MLNVRPSSAVTNAEQDANGQWAVEVDRKGRGKQTLSKQLVMGTLLAGAPYPPAIPGLEQFKGNICTWTEHGSSSECVGNKVLVVGISSSGFDTAYDFACRGLT